MAEKTIKLPVESFYLKSNGGVYYYHYQVDEKRKAVSLKTSKLKLKHLEPISKQHCTF